MIGSRNTYCILLYRSTCSLVAWGIDETVFEFMYECGFEEDTSCQLWRCSMRERGMGGFGVICMGI